MTDFCNNSVYFGVAISLVGYVIGVQLKKKFKFSGVKSVNDFNYFCSWGCIAF